MSKEFLEAGNDLIKGNNLYISALSGAEEMINEMFQKDKLEIFKAKDENTRAAFEFLLIQIFFKSLLSYFKASIAYMSHAILFNMINVSNRSNLSIDPTITQNYDPNTHHILTQIRGSKNKPRKDNDD